MAVTEADVIAIADARRTAMRAVIEEMDVQRLLDKMESLPEQIRRHQEGAAAAKRALEEAEGERQLQESILWAEICSEVNPNTQKPAFSNDGTRKAELEKRKSTNAEYKAAAKNVADAQEALRTADFDLQQLEREFLASWKAVDFKGALIQALAS